MSASFRFLLGASGSLPVIGACEALSFDARSGSAGPTEPDTAREPGTESEAGDGADG